jgi:hypothetical protein
MSKMREHNKIMKMLNIKEINNFYNNKTLKIKDKKFKMVIF